MTEWEIRRDEEDKLSAMIRHHPDTWWNSGQIAEAVRQGLRCKEGCELCEIESRTGTRV